MMKGNTYKAAIIGCGKIAGGYGAGKADGLVLTHAAAYADQPRTELAACADSDEYALDRFAGAWKVPAKYTDVRDMLEREAPEIVSICAPSGEHGRMLRHCLSSPSVKGIWCEKPLATGSSPVKGLLKNGRKVLYVNHLRSWDKAVEALRKLISERRLGLLRYGRFVYTRDFLENGSHITDLILRLLGPWDKAEIIDPGYSAEGPGREKFAADIRLHLSGRRVVDLICNRGRFNLFEMDLLFQDGRVITEDNGFRVVARGTAQSRIFKGHKWLSPAGKEIGSDLGTSMSRILNSLIRDIDSKDGWKNNLGHELLSYEMYGSLLKKLKRKRRSCRN